MNWDLFKFFGGVLGSLFLIFCLISQINFMIENVPLRVSVDGKEVFHGRSACVDTKSVGSSSQVNTHQGPWCLFPKEYFAGKNIVIVTDNQR